MIICVITLIILATNCSNGAKKEEFVETIILGLRNVVQVVRLCFAIRKNKRNLSARENTIDFTSLRSRSMPNRSAGQYDNAYSLQQLATSDGFVLDEDEEF